MVRLFNTIILLGCIQGLIVSSLLFFSKKNRRSNRILALLIFLMTLAGFNLYGNYENWFGYNILNILSQVIPMVNVMAIGPLIFFYVQSSLDTSFRITGKKRRHFYSMLIDFVPSLLVIGYIIGSVTHIIHIKPGPIGSFIDNYNVYADIPRWISITLYVWLSANYLADYKQKNNGISGNTPTQLKWMQQFIKGFMIFQAIWLVYLVPYVIPRYTDWMLNTFDWYPLYIPMAILIYWMGIKGYMVSQQQMIIDKKPAVANTAPISPELVQQVSASLIRVMEEERVFLNPQLNLATMATITGFSQKLISSVLNQYLEKSFNEFINEYRVATFKEKVASSEMNHLTIAGIALECGFNSQATFQRTFKEITGQSPSSFRKSMLEIV